MTLLLAAKQATRTTNDFYKDELLDLLEAGKSDLRKAGIYFEDVDNEIDLPTTFDPLIKRALMLYAKAFFGYDNPDAEKFEKSYVSLKQHLQLSGDYNAPLE